MKVRIATSFFAICAAALSSPARAIDYKLSEQAFVSVDTTAFLSATKGGDDEGLFARGLSKGTFNYSLGEGISLGAAAQVQAFSNYDKHTRNIGEGTYGQFYTGIGYLTTKLGDVLGGKTFGAVSEMLDVAPSAIGLNYSVWTPWFIHVGRPRFAPRSPTTSPDFRESTTRIGYYSPNHDGFQFGATYAPEIESKNAASLTTVTSKDALDLAVAYKGYVENATIRVSGGYQTANADVKPVNIQTAANQSHYAGSVSVNWKGFTVAGGAMYTQNTLGLRNIDNFSYNVGIMYGWSLYQVSASFGASTDRYPRDAKANPILFGLGDAKMDMLEIAGSYRITPNATISVAGVHVNYDDKVIAPAATNSGDYGVVQYKFSF